MSDHFYRIVNQLKERERETLYHLQWEFVIGVGGEGSKRKKFGTGSLLKAFSYFNKVMIIINYFITNNFGKRMIFTTIIFSN